jgi:hypothetical protein
MGWLDANDYLLMAVVARERVDDLHSSIDLAVTSGEDGDEARPDVPAPGNAGPEPALVNARLRA